MAASLAKASVAKNKINVVAEDLGGIPFAKQVATGAGHEIIFARLLAGGTSAVVRIVDTANITADINAGGYAFERGVALGAGSSRSDSFSPNRPMPMTKGIAVVFEEGSASNPECFLMFD